MQKKEILTPQDSLDLIFEVIDNTRSKFQENGIMFIIWGILIFLCSISQFILLTLGKHEYNYYPYYIMPAGGVFTYLYYLKKNKKSIAGKKSSNIFSQILKTMGISLGLNFLAIGFIFFFYFGNKIYSSILLLLGIWLTISGTVIKFRALLYAGILVNLAAYLCVFIPVIYYPVVLAVSSLIGLVIPGILLYKQSVKSE